MSMETGACTKEEGTEALEEVVVFLPLEGVIGVLPWAGAVLAQIKMGPRFVTCLRRS
jgi:hypothetical protein